jgi:hypothetical protein
MDYSAYSNLPVDQTVNPVFSTTYFIAVGVLAIIAIVSMWKIFTKAGKPGWASIIPVYNAIVLLQIVGYSGWTLLLFFVPIVNIIFSIMVYHRLSQSFGHGVGFTLGLLFLNPIFFMLLAFGKSTYTPIKKSDGPKTPASPPATPAVAPAVAPAAATPTEAKK